MPASSIECRVIDDESKKPIAGAELVMIYIGPNADDPTIRRGPFLTDQNGEGHVVVGREILWGGGSANFGGEYTRQIEVHAAGYEKSGYWENFDRGLLEKKAPLIFSLKPFRNRFGAVQVLADVDEGDVQTLSLEVIDGPHAGERFVLQTTTPTSDIRLLGKRLYLKQSLEDIRKNPLRYQRLPIENFEMILREGWPNEPYDPPKE